MIKYRSLLKTILVAIAAFAVVQFVNAASVYSGTATGGGENDNQISLKNLGKFRSYISVPTLKLSQFQYKGSYNFTQTKTTGNILQINSTIKLQSGNTTYVYPYKYKMKLQTMFATPSQPLH